MFRLLATLLVLLFTLPALAGAKDCEWKPPDRYQDKPAVEYRVIRAPQRQVQQICARELSKLGLVVQPDYRGCAIPGKVWRIYIVRGGYKCASEKAILEHELGHLNGWHADHPE